jgi:prepilin signal peptidase PulO-like enzyme (type II secretory pathway)
VLEPNYEILFRMSIVVITYLFIIGIIFGSFINAWVWRLRQQLNDDGEPIKLSNKQRKELSILHGRSMCPQCKHPLAAKDLLPVVSWLWLKGKCRYCKAPISKQYPIIELFSGVLFAASYVLWPVAVTGYEWIVFIGWLVTLVPLITMALYDAKWFILPSTLIYIGIASYGSSLLVYSALSSNLSIFWNALVGALVYCGLFLGIYYGSFLANKQGWADNDWLGFGDVRLALLLGLIAGSAFNVFIAIFVASMIGLLFTLPSIARQKTTLTTQIPFGPFLIIGATLALFFGSSIVDWYTSGVLGI